jgi:hypothetical protein
MEEGHHIRVSMLFVYCEEELLDNTGSIMNFFPDTTQE